MLFEIPVLCFIFVLLESNGGYGATSQAFIFSLNNSEGLAPFVSKVKQEKVEKAIQRHSYYGPKFGEDLIIHVKASRKRDSEARLGQYYSVPASVKNKFTILAGPGRLDGSQRYFTPDEVEVFYLDPSRQMQDNTN